MDGFFPLATCALFIRRKRKQRPQGHRFWVHPIHRSRKTYGEYHRLVMELRLDAVLFQQCFRLNTEQFDSLLTRVGPLIYKMTTSREPIGPPERLAICLR